MFYDAIASGGGGIKLIVNKCRRVDGKEIGKKHGRMYWVVQFVDQPQDIYMAGNLGLHFVISTLIGMGADVSAIDKRKSS